MCDSVRMETYSGNEHNNMNDFEMHLLCDIQFIPFVKLTVLS